MLRHVLSTRHTPLLPPHQVVKILLRVLVFHIGWNQVKLVRRRVPFNEIVIWNIVIDLLLQQNRCLIAPRSTTFLIV